jgi:hypothetical protein
VTGERLVALVFLTLGGAYLWIALGFPMGSAARPGPGLFPVAVGVLICVVAMAMVVRAATEPATRGERATVEADARARVAVTAAALVGFCLALPYLGYAVASFVFVALLLKWLGGGRWVAAIAIALATTAVSYVLFSALLGVPLPRGPLG